MLVLHAQTNDRLEQVLSSKPQSILLTGPQGIGKGSVANQLATSLLSIDNLDSYAYFKRLTPDDKQTISIEAIRDLQQFLRLTTTGQNPIRRAVIIEQAERLTTEGQNAFLKTLEEPPQDTVLILTADSGQNLLPTIRSRLQEITLLAPLKEDLEHYFSVAYDRDKVLQTYLMSAGLPGLMTALLTENQDHPLYRAVQQAKTILNQTSFERLTTVDTFKQKTDAWQLCQALQRIAKTSIEQAAVINDRTRLGRWQKILRASIDAQQTLSRNANLKLTLTQLFLQL